MECRNQGQSVERIGKYLEHWKFESLLQNRALYLGPLRCFTDEYEGFIHEEYFNDFFFKTIPISHDQGERNALLTLKRGIRHIKDCTFVSCWTTRTIPSDDMWMEYVRYGDGVFVLVDKEVLLKHLGVSARNRNLNMQSGIVKYFDLNKTYFEHPPDDTSREKPPLSPDEPDVLPILENGDFLFIKANTFEFEQEYRITVSRCSGIDFGQWRNLSNSIGAEYATMGVLNHIRIDSEEEYEKVMALPPPEAVLMAVPLEDIICDIYFKPGVNNDYIRTVRFKLKQFGLDNLLAKLRT